MPGLVPGAATLTSTLTSPSASSTDGMIGNVFKLEPVSASAIWYHQPWTLPVAWLLGVYSIASFMLVWILLFSARLDFKGNVIVHSHGLYETVAHCD